MKTNTPDTEYHWTDPDDGHPEDPNNWPAYVAIAIILTAVVCYLIFNVF